MFFYVVSSSSYNSYNYRNQFVLIHSNWDDWFRYETLYHLCYIDDRANRVDIGDVKIGQLEMGNDQRQPQLPNQFDALSEEFFSLGQSDYYYEHLTKLSDGIREEVMKKLHDISYDLQLYKQVRELEVTKISLMRSITDFEIRYQLHRIAHGSARLTDYLIEYTYPFTGGDAPAKLSFEVVPESNPPTNIHVLIGRNNVGKTFFIQNFIRAVYGDERAGSVKSSSTGLDDNPFRMELQAFANIMTISFSPFDDYKGLEIYSSRKEEMPYLHIGLRDGNLQEENTNLFLNGLDSCQKSNRKLKLLRRAVEILETDPIFERAKIGTLLKLNSESMEETFDNSARKVFSLLSSGHQVILLTLTQLVDKITEKSLIILDEPENHLHPPLLSAFIRALSELLIDRNAVAFIATHSPVVLQEVPSSCVWKINRSGNEISVSRPDIQTFGATIGSLTREVFGLEVRKSGFHKLLFDEVEAGQSYSEILEKFNNQLGDEARLLLHALIILRDSDEKPE